MPNRERILVTALRLFNERGAAVVSTNHIAAAAEISPGNLYYHFRNKEEIVRALFERLFERRDRIFALPENVEPSLADVRHLVRGNFDALCDYRFAYRELAALLRRDEVLRERWLDVRRRGYVSLRALIASLIAAGAVAAPSAPDVVERIADLCWLISEFWLPSLEVSGQPVEAPQLERGVALMLQVLNSSIEPSEHRKDFRP